MFFIRYNQTPQNIPNRCYEPEIFDRFLKLTNVQDKQNKLLLKVYIISLFISEIAHAILILHGEKGSAKSTLQLLIKMLVDPTKPSLLTMHKDRTEFVQQLSHNYVAFYDNLKHAPYWLSDEVCKAVTGIGQTKRKLYTDDDDVVYEYKRCLGFNGINVSLTEPDAIQIKSSIMLNDLPRMADFALWGEAISQAMGNRALQFINAYYENIGRQNIEAIESHPLGQAIAKYFQDDSENSLKELSGSPMEVLEILEVFAEQYKIDTRHKLWPKSPNSLSRRLNQIRSNLLEGLGIEVTISRLTTDRSGSKANTSYIKIRKIPPVSPIPPADQNDEKNCQKTTGDISSTGDIISPVNKIPPVLNTENDAQKTVVGDIGDTGGILDISMEQALLQYSNNNMSIL